MRTQPGSRLRRVLVVPAGARAGTDRGAGSVLVVGAVLVLTTVAVAGLLLAAAVTATHRARASADAAALAAAAALVRGASPGAACATAGVVADRSGGRLTACRPSVGPGSAEVEVVVPVPDVVRRLGVGAARGRARAGPGAVSRAGRPPGGPRRDPPGLP